MDDIPEEAPLGDDPEPPEPKIPPGPNPEDCPRDVPLEPAAIEDEGKPETIGDDLTTKNIPDIECECTPTPAGGAAPALCSSIDDLKPGTSATDGKGADDEIKSDEVAMGDPTNESSEDLIDEVNIDPIICPHNSEIDATYETKCQSLEISEAINAYFIKQSSPVKPKPPNLLDSSCNELFQKLHMLIKNTVVNDIVNAAIGEPVIPSGSRRRDTSVLHSKSVSKSRPSLIPKPSRPNSAQLDPTPMEKLQEKLNVMKCSSKLPPQGRSGNRNVKSEDPSSSFSSTGKNAAPSKPIPKPMSATISSFSAGKSHLMAKSTTQKIPAAETTKATPKKVPAAETHSFSAGKSPFLGATPKPTDSKKKLQRPVAQPRRQEPPEPLTPAEEIHRLIAQMQHVINDNFAKTHWKSQRENINKLVTNLNEIKTLIDTSFVEKDAGNKDNSCSQTDNIPQYVVKKENTAILKSKSKNNKVYIKFVHSNDRADKRDSSDRLCELVKLTSEEEEAKIENKVKDADSMDGVFIPTSEAPVNIEEEEEESNGLDITITFPQITELAKTESKLAVSLSDISEGALKKLKRCPKDFTLHMDFVQGTVQFQSGITPLNNFSIGPDFKFIENPPVLHDIKSEVINIKPSTECKFTSQPVSLENVERTSHKSLKSTDSELFNVVNLPCVYKNSSLNAVTKSCTTFRNEYVFSDSMTKQLVKSTPQIQSLVNLLEDKHFDNANKAALALTDKKRKGRNVQKKLITSTTTL